jgi:hypothetical protein
MKPNDLIRLIRSEAPDFAYETMNYRKFLKDFDVILDALIVYLKNHKKIDKKVMRNKKASEAVRSTAFKKAKAEHGIGSVLPVATWKGPKLAIKDERGIEEQAPDFFQSNVRGQHKGSDTSGRRQWLLRWTIEEYNKRQNVDFHYPTINDAQKYLEEKRTEYNADKSNTPIGKKGYSKTQTQDDLRLIKRAIVAYINKKEGKNYPDPTISTRKGKPSIMLLEEKAHYKGNGLVMKGI